MAACGCGETIDLSVAGDPGDDYEAVVTKAMSRVLDFLPDGHALRREPSECETARAEWYVDVVKASVSPGGTTIALNVRFRRYEGDGSDG